MSLCRKTWNCQLLYIKQGVVVNWWYINIYSHTQHTLVHSCSCIMTWWWLIFRVKASCQVNDHKCVFCVTVNIYTHCECYTYGDASYKGWNFVWHAAQLHYKCHILCRDKNTHRSILHINLSCTHWHDESFILDLNLL